MKRKWNEEDGEENENQKSTNNKNRKLPDNDDHFSFNNMTTKKEEERIQKVTTEQPSSQTHTLRMCPNCTEEKIEELCSNDHEQCISAYLRSFRTAEEIPGIFLYLLAKHGQIFHLSDVLRTLKLDINIKTIQEFSLLQTSIIYGHVNDVVKLLNHQTSVIMENNKMNNNEEKKLKQHVTDTAAINYAIENPQLLFQLLKFYQNSENFCESIENAINKCLLTRNNQSLQLLLSFFSNQQSQKLALSNSTSDHPSINTQNQGRRNDNLESEREELITENVPSTGYKLKNNPLHIAAGVGYIEGIEALLQNHFPINATHGADNITALHIAASKGYTECVKVLLQHPNCKPLIASSQTSMYPLHFAAFNGHTECLQVFLTSSPEDVNVCSPKTRFTPLHYAAANGHLQSVKLLLEMGADVTIPEMNGNTALLYSAYCSHFECGKLIAEKTKSANVLKKWIFLLLIEGSEQSELSNLDSTTTIHSSGNDRPNDGITSLLIVKRHNDDIFPALQRLQNIISNYNSHSNFQKNNNNNMNTSSSNNESNIEDQIISANNGIDNNNLKSFKKIPFLSVEFEGEIGKGPGVLREWLTFLSKHLSSQSTNLFISNDSNRTFYPKGITNLPEITINNRNNNNYNDILKERLTMMRMIGYLLGIILVNCQTIPFRFCSPIISALRGNEIMEEDLLYIDKEFYLHRICYLRDLNSEEELEELNLTFSVDEFGRNMPLLPGGEHIAVTVSNKLEYLRLISQHKLFGCHRKEMIESLVYGFQESLPYYALISKVFDDKMLQEALFGEPEISIDDWKHHTRYYCDPNALQVVWFWEFVEGLDQHQRSRLISFITGSSILPVGGFQQLEADFLPFSMHISPPSSNVQNGSGFDDLSLPTSCTCTNTLFLPPSSSKQYLFLKLNFVISECYSGFGFI